MGFFRIVLLCFSLLGPLEGAVLHLIQIGDVSSRDIRRSIFADLERIQTEALKICHYTGMTPSIHSLWGVQATSSALLERCRTLEVGKEDLIFFYFSGHGFRLLEKKDPWPSLYLPPEQSGLDLSLLIDLLEAKRARLLIVLVDCCNHLSPHLGHGSRLYRYQGTLKWDPKLEAGYRSLFLHFSGKILLAAAEAGKVAYCTEEGGFYTLRFLQRLSEEVRFEENANWNSLTERLVISLEGFQVPITLLDLVHESK